MSIVASFVIAAAAMIDLAAAWHLRQGWRETSPDRIRTISRRASTLAASSLFVSFLAPVVGVALAFRSNESFAPEERARQLAQGIADAMKSGPLALVVAVPGLLIAVLLSRRSRAVQREHGAKSP
jgi:hypothetical protein